MSHFTVLVIGVNAEEKLKPYWELDLRSEDMANDSRAVFVDETEKYQEEYKTGKRKSFYCQSNSSWGVEIEKNTFLLISEAKVGEKITHVKIKDRLMLLKEYRRYRVYYQKSNGKRCDDWNTYIQVDEIVKNGKDYILSVTKIEPPKDILFESSYKSFEHFVQEWHGATKIEKPVLGPKGGKTKKTEPRYGYWHNPNAKWDWYELGGRWTGFFPIKEGCFAMEVGRPGLMTSPAPPNTGDKVLKKCIDFSKLHLVPEKMTDAARYWELIVEGQEPQNDEEKETVRHNFYNPEYFTKTYKDKETYMKCFSSFSTHAVITRDGKWHEVGEMGWWGVCDEKQDARIYWELNFYDRFIKDLPDNVILSLYDCHI